MVYELPIEEILEKAKQLEAKGDLDADLVEYAASAVYYRTCAILKEHGVSDRHPAVFAAEQMYLTAIKRNKTLDFSSPGGRALRILKSVLALEKVVCE